MGQSAAPAIDFGQPANANEKWISHYSSFHTILLVGEGDFSFSACLARAFGSAENITATSLDTKGELHLEYGSVALQHLSELERRGCTLFHGIDVKNMHEDPRLNDKRFDCIIFNFPHAGHGFFLRETNEELIMRHRALVGDFFSSAKCLLSRGGEIHVTHRDDQPYYQKWGIQSCAKDRGLILQDMAVFDQNDYPGYEPKRGGGIRSDETFPIGEESSWQNDCGRTAHSFLSVGPA